MTTPQTMSDLVRRIEVLERRNERRIGTIVDRSLADMLFGVELIDGETATIVTGVRMLYMRQNEQLTAWMVPSVGETVVLERLGSSWVIVGTYAHDIGKRVEIETPFTAHWDTRRDIPFEVQANDGGVQLTSFQKSSLSNIDIGSDALVYLGKVSGRPPSSGPDASDVMACIVTSRYSYAGGTALDPGIGVELVVTPFLFIIHAVVLDEDGKEVPPEPDNRFLSNILVEVDKDDIDQWGQETESAAGHKHKLPIRATNVAAIHERKERIP